MDEKPKRKNSSPTPTVKLVLIIAVSMIVGCGVCFAGFFGILHALLAPVTEVADTFMTSMRDEDYYEAFNQLSYNLKSQSENPQRLESLVLEYTAEPDAWNFTNRSVENNYGELSGNSANSLLLMSPWTRTFEFLSWTLHGMFRLPLE